MSQDAGRVSGDILMCNARKAAIFATRGVSLLAKYLTVAAAGGCAPTARLPTTMMAVVSLSSTNRTHVPILSCAKNTCAAEKAPQAQQKDQAVRCHSSFETKVQHSLP